MNKKFSNINISNNYFYFLIIFIFFFLTIKNKTIMSNGGSFKLITNDGKQDDMILSTRFLNARLSKIKMARGKNPNVRDPTPSLVDIEKTHMLFVNAHFKPYVAVGYEYSVTSVNSAQLGSQVTISLPLYGDFIHDMVLHIRLGEVSAKATGTGNQLLRYVDYPGERICRTTEFSVNGNVLDKYDSDVFPFHREHYVQPNKKEAYDRLMGQQTAIKGKVLSSQGRSVAETQETTLYNGYQTPKATQPALDLWVKSLLWFSLDVRLSLMSVAIPHGQRFLKVDLETAQNLLQHCALQSVNDAPGSNPVASPNVETIELYINNIFVNPEIHEIIIKRIGFSLIRVHRLQRELLDKPNNSNILLSQFKWPIETIWLGVRPSENFDYTNTLMAEGWHRHVKMVKSVHKSGSMHTNALKVGTIANNPVQALDYTQQLSRVDGLPTGLDFVAYLNANGYPAVVATTVISVTQVNLVLQGNGYQPLSGTFVNANAPTPAEVALAMPNTGTPVEYYTETNPLTELGLQAHGIELYKSFPSVFYNSYLPHHFGGEKIRTSSDTGKHMMPFNFYPGTYQPSGHINVSRAREFYLSYKSGIISSSYTAELYLIGVAINFLLISDGSAVLRYAT